jgi:hypothetical protein
MHYSYPFRICAAVKSVRGRSTIHQARKVGGQSLSHKLFGRAMFTRHSSRTEYETAAYNISRLSPIGQLILPGWDVKYNFSVDELTLQAGRKLLDASNVDYKNWGDPNILRKISKINPMDVLLREIGCIPDKIREEFLSDNAESMRSILNHTYTNFDDFKFAYKQLSRQKYVLSEDLLLKVFCGKIEGLIYWKALADSCGIYDYIIKPSEQFEQYRLIVPTNTFRDTARGQFPKAVMNVLDLNYIPADEKNEPGEQLVKYSKLWETVVASRLGFGIKMHQNDGDKMIPLSSLFGRNVFFLTDKSLPSEFVLPKGKFSTLSPYLTLPRRTGVYHTPNGTVELNEIFFQLMFSGNISWQDVGVFSFEGVRDHPVADVSLLLHDGTRWHFILISVKGSRDGIGPSSACLDRVTEFLRRDVMATKWLQERLGPDVVCSLGYILAVDDSYYIDYKLDLLLEKAKEELIDLPVFIVHDMQEFLPVLAHRTVFDGRENADDTTLQECIPCDG